MSFWLQHGFSKLCRKDRSGMVRQALAHGNLRAANRLTNVGAITYTWDANGNLTNVDGQTKTYTYDAAHRLTSIASQTLTQTLSAYTYTLDAVGQRVGAVEVVQGLAAPAQTITYTHDPLYRIYYARSSASLVARRSNK